MDNAVIEFPSSKYGTRRTHESSVSAQACGVVSLLVDSKACGRDDLGPKEPIVPFVQVGRSQPVHRKMTETGMYLRRGQSVSTGFPAITHLVDVTYPKDSVTAIE